MVATATDPRKQLPPDPVIAWLERCRDFPGATGDSRELAQRAIDRLSGADIPTLDEVVEQLREDLGNWRRGRGCVVSDKPGPIGGTVDDIRYYGGYMVGESMAPKACIAVAKLPQLLDVARATPEGRDVLAAIARELLAPPEPPRTYPADRLDGALRLSALADDFSLSDLYGAAEVLRWLSAALVMGRSAELSAVVGDFMRQEQEAIRSRRR